MPFTLAHPIAAYPLWQLSQKRLNLLGLMVGTIVPDLGDFLGLPLIESLHPISAKIFNMVHTKPTPTPALAEFLRSPNLEESPAWELFAAVVSQKPMPTLHHSILQKRLVGAIDRADSEYEAFPELRCVLATNSVVPDITILRRDRLPMGNQPIIGAPDWLIEILSPDQSTTKLITKIQTCLAEGTGLGWLIDAEERVVMGFQPGQPLMLYRGTDRLPVLGTIDLSLTVNQLFAWLPSA